VALLPGIGAGQPGVAVEPRTVVSSGVSSSIEIRLRCPICRQPATAMVRWTQRGGAPHAEVSDFHCPNGDQVDAETVREIIGAQ
jgi:hypothetical protein